MLNWRGAGAVILSAVLFGTFGILIRIAFAAGADAYTLLLLRFAIAGAVMAALVAARRERLPRGRSLFALALLGALGYFGQSLCYALAIGYASPGLVALLLYTYPAVVTLLDALLNRAVITRVKLAALLLAMLGSALTVGGELGGQPEGILLALGAALIYSVYIIAGNRVVRGISAVTSSGVIMAGAAVSFGALVWARGFQPPAGPAGWAAVVAIALLCTVAAMLLFFAGLRRVGPSSAGMLSSFEPVTTLALSALVLGETISPPQAAGGALIVLSALVLARA